MDIPMRGARMGGGRTGLASTNWRWSLVNRRATPLIDQRGVPLTPERTRAIDSAMARRRRPTASGLPTRRRRRPTVSGLPMRRIRGNAVEFTP
jgi:hypothetical protein